MLGRPIANKILITTFLFLLVSCGDSGTVSDGLFAKKLRPGYEWSNKSSFFDFSTVWMPGKLYAENVMLLSSGQKDYWEPLQGYVWNDNDSRNARKYESFSEVVWRPGLKHDFVSHVYASGTPMYWLPEKGYLFQKSGLKPTAWLADDSLITIWQPGQKDPDRPHVIASATEGTWEFEPGYQQGAYGAVWTPGLKHPNQQCLQSSATEGVWNAISGYKLEKNTQGRVLISKIDHETDWGKVVIGGIAGLIGFLNSQTHDDDSLVDSAGHAIAGKVGEAGINAAADELFGSNSGSCDGIILPPDWK